VHKYKYKYLDVYGYIIVWTAFLCGTRITDVVSVLFA